MGHATSQGRWRTQRKPEHAARWAWSHVSLQRIPPRSWKGAEANLVEIYRDKVTPDVGWA